MLAASTLAAAPAATADTAAGEDWRQILNARLPLYGHRNWIVVADSAYPAQSRSGIETILSNGEHFEVLKGVLAALSSSQHVRPIVYQDQELKSVPEQDAPGVDQCRQRLASIFANSGAKVLPHEEIIAKLDQAAQTFDILIIKTTLTIPYTSVFFQLDCAYWPADAEKRLRAAKAH